MSIKFAFVCFLLCLAYLSLVAAQDCACIAQHAPVCASDGKTYENEGCMQCADPTLTVVSQGECPNTNNKDCS